LRAKRAERQAQTTPAAAALSADQAQVAAPVLSAATASPTAAAAGAPPSSSSGSAGDGASASPAAATATAATAAAATATAATAEIVIVEADDDESGIRALLGLRKFVPQNVMDETLKVFPATVSAGHRNSILLVPPFTALKPPGDQNAQIGAGLYLKSSRRLLFHRDIVVFEGQPKRIVAFTKAVRQGRKILNYAFLRCFEEDSLYQVKVDNNSHFDIVDPATLSAECLATLQAITCVPPSPGSSPAPSPAPIIAGKPKRKRKRVRPCVLPSC
jgi:hypothetical protein